MQEETTSGQLQGTEDEGKKGAPESTVPITDDALAFAGLQKVTAYVRAKPSGNAKRKQRSREKSEQEGVKQLNLQLPLPMHPVFKDIARELQLTGDVAKALQNVLSKFAPPAESCSRKGEQLKGWRHWLGKLLSLL